MRKILLNVLKFQFSRIFYFRRKTMKSYIMRCILLGLILCCTTASASAEGESKDTAVSRLVKKIENRYAGHSFSATFFQTSVLAALESKETAQGRVQFSHPGKMRWSYTKPEQHEIITNGKKVWIWRPDQNQVMTGDASSFFTSGVGATFLSDMADIEKAYHVKILSENPDWTKLELRPKKLVPEMEKIVVKVMAATRDIVRVTTYNSYGDSTSFNFDKIRFETIPESVFEFAVPKGAEVISMNNN